VLTAPLGWASARSFYVLHNLWMRIGGLQNGIFSRAQKFVECAPDDPLKID